MTPTRRRYAVPAAALLTALAVLTGCGSEDPESATAQDAGGAYPVTVTNCEAEVTFESEPARVVLLKSAAVPYLHDLGVMDRVTARAGQYPEAYYDQATLDELEAIPLLTDKTDTSGHLQISKEVVIGQEPDLVLGQVDNLARDTLSAVGIPLLEEPALCEQGVEDPGFDDVYAQLETYGRVFDRPDQAASAVMALKQRLTEVEAEVEVSDALAGRTAAVLYPTVGGGVTYAYGTKSMADPQLRAAGLTNVFGDVDERVFEVTLEELLGRDPDYLILLYSDGDPAAVTQAVTDLPGAEQLTAVRNGDLMPQLFNFTEPPTPLSVDGLEQIVRRFG